MNLTNRKAFVKFSVPIFLFLIIIVTLLFVHIAIAGYIIIPDDTEDAWANGTTPFTDPHLIVDEDWDTYGYTYIRDPIIYVNYTIPGNTQNAIMETKFACGDLEDVVFVYPSIYCWNYTSDWEGGFLGSFSCGSNNDDKTVNKTIPNDCLSGSVLQIKIVSADDPATTPLKVYEERIFWNVSSLLPNYTDNSTNSTLAGSAISHNLKWNDDNGLSGYIFSFNNATGLINSTPTNIDTTGSTYPTLNFNRPICRDGNGNIHVTYRYDNGVVKYTNSSDDGATWHTPITLATAFLLYDPSISCDGNNIFIAYTNGEALKVEINKSTDAGATWEGLTNLPPTNEAEKGSSEVWVTGNRVYVIWLNRTIGGEAEYVAFFNSTDLGVTWGNNINVIKVSDINFDHTSLFVVGTGTDTDKIYVVGEDITSATGKIYFSNSSDAGANWQQNYTIMEANGNYKSPSILATSSNIYVAATNYSGVNPQSVMLVNSSDGLTWSSPTRIDDIGTVGQSPSIALNGDKRPVIIYIDNDDVVFKEYNSTGWDSAINVTTTVATEFCTNSNPKFYNNKLDIVWHNGTDFLYDQLYYHLTNDTWVAFSTNPDWSNVTKTVNSIPGRTIRWCVYANDTYNQWNGTSCIIPFSYQTSPSEDETNPQWSDNKTSPSSPTTYGIIIQLNVTWTDNAFDKCLIEQNFTTQTSTVENVSMTREGNECYYNIDYNSKAGTYQWKSFGNDTTNNQNVTDTWTYTINQAPTEMNTLLNGTDGDESYDQYEIANFTTYVNISGKTVKLNSNMTGFTQQSGTTPLYNYTNLSQTGTFYINGSFDGDENYTASFEVHYFTVSDVISPIITGVQSTGITSESANIQWTTNENANSSLVISPSATYSNSSSYVTSHSISLTVLTAETTYYYNVTSCDASNNCNTSTGYQFTTISEGGGPSGGGPSGCTENWTCSAWSTCVNNLQTRTCIDSNSCGTTTNKPIISQNCTIAPPITGPLNISLNDTYPEFPFVLPNGTTVYYPTRFAAIVSSLLSGNFQGIWLNIVYSMTDYYYKPKLDYGPLNIMFMHITIFLGLYIVLGLFIRWIKLFKKFSATFKALIYFIILPLLCLLISLFFPSIV